MATDFDSLIDEKALKPAEVASDNHSFKAHSLPDLIAAAKFQAQTAALANGQSAWGATRPARLVLPSSVGPSNTETQ